MRKGHVGFTIEVGCPIDPDMVPGNHRDWMALPGLSTRGGPLVVFEKAGPLYMGTPLISFAVT